MSATSGIGVSQELTDAFAAAVDTPDVRFIKISIRNESLVPEETIPRAGPVEEDLDKLQIILDDNVPAYVLVRLDDGTWLAVFYVPETAKVRDKMLYAATRNNLTKALGSTHFIDSLFATSKGDLTPDAYVAHKRHIAAPKPLSAREQEAANARAAEAGAAYEGRHARASPALDTGAGVKWADGVEEAVKGLAGGDEGRVVVLTIEPRTETLTLASAKECTVEELGAALPISDPCYAFYAWPRTPSRREIILIYSCPSSSPVKYRMLYSANASALFNTAKQLFAPGSAAATPGGALPVLAHRRVETSDPRELDEAFLREVLGFETSELDAPSSAAVPAQKSLGAQGGGFAKPKGPGRKR